MTETKFGDKKINRKVLKCLTSICSDIPSLRNCLEPTVNILLCNAGLITGTSREDVVQLFREFGEICDVFMVPGKSYCFIRFQSVDGSLNCFNHLNGSMQNVDNSAKTIYLCYVESIPENLLTYGPIRGELPEGLKLLEEFITEEEEAELLRIAHWEADSCDLKHRKVKHYGFTFLYDSNNVDRENPIPGGFPEQLKSVMEKFVSENVIPFMPDQLTVNQYNPGQGIPSHIDTHSAFEDGIISLSLGSSVIMEFKHGDGRHIPVLLPRRSCLLMSGEARYLWSHGITPRKNDVVVTPSHGMTLQSRGVRTSLTFRKVRWTPCDCRFFGCCDSRSPGDPNLLEQAADLIELTHVFQVYEEIAPHFSDTRHKPWPQVLNFVNSLPMGAVLVDIGCGNGKYLGHNPHIFDIGCDRSGNLLQVCRSRSYQVFRDDCRRVALRDGVADACISIAVIHHLATAERRLEAIQGMVRLLRSGGRALIYVWAKEQQRGQKKSTYLLQQPREISSASSVNTPNTATLLPVHENRTNFKHSDVLVPWKLNPKTASLRDSSSRETTYHRFYHVFTEGELEALCSLVAGVTIVESYYDQGNWCVIFRKD